MEQLSCSTRLLKRLCRPCSVDGLHVSDLQYIVTTQLPNGNLSYLAGLGTTYTNASTSAPSDSFPGIMALHSGAASFAAPWHCKVAVRVLVRQTAPRRVSPIVPSRQCSSIELSQ